MQEKFKKDGRRLPNWQVLYINMKQKFSTKWKASKQPRKKRKYLANAPKHIKRKMISATLSKELRTKYGRNIEIRKGDEVEIMRGTFKKKKGKISGISMKKMKASIEGIQRTKKDGSKVNVWIHASKLRIIGLNNDDKKRMKRKTEKMKEEKSKIKKIEKQEKQNVSKKTSNA